MHWIQSMALIGASPPVRPEAGPGVRILGAFSFVRGVGSVLDSAERCHLDWAGLSAGVG